VAKELQMSGMRAWSCVGIALLAAGCGVGNGVGLDENGRPIGEGGGGPLTATFSSIQDNVFTPNCAISGCHSGATAPHGLRLDKGVSYSLLVNVPSDEVPSIDRVEPGDPDNSYIIQKLEGRASVGARMPFGGPYLSQDTIDVIRQWITDGAQEDAGPTGAPPTVVSTTPADGASVDAFPTQVVVLFDADMDASLVSSATITLTASGGDGTFDDGNEAAVAPASVALDAGNARRAVLDLTGVQASADTFELRLSGGDPVAIADVDGNVLDGDGDGQPGGDFVATFTFSEVAATLESIQEHVFTPICSVCHTGDGTELPGVQDLTSAQASFDNLVSVASLEVPSLDRVKPGDADASYIIHKLEGADDIVGDQMPQGMAPLPASTIQAIRAWIDAGALFEGGGADVTAPTVTLGDVAATVSGSVTLSANASDDVGVVSVEFFVDDVSIGTDTTAPYSVQWDTTAEDNGQHELTVQASDAANNVGHSAAHTVEVSNDVVAPEATITSPANGATVGGSVAVIIDASDDVGVMSVDLLVDDAVVGSDDTAPYQVLWSTTDSGDGAHTLVARAVDAAGNAGESAAVNVTVDNSCTGDANPPTVAITAPAPGPVGGTVTVAADADDDVGVTQVLFFADAVLIGTAVSAPYEIQWDSTTVSDGAVSLTARASDACGNETTSAAVDVDVDNSALSVVDVVPPQDEHVTTLPASITVTFNEAVDETTVVAGTFKLVRSGGDGTFDDGNEVAVNAPVSASGTGATMDLSGVGSVLDTYQVTLTDGIEDLAGNALDGDGDGAPGGDFTMTFLVGATYTDDAQPIFFDKCDPCHTGLGLGGHNIGINYQDAFLPAGIFLECTGLVVGQCTIVLIQEGVMPFNAGCTGDPVQDANNPKCLTQEQQDVIQAWIDSGMPE
jgi:methionine-rich copper-binding protein CopC